MAVALSVTLPISPKTYGDPAKDLLYRKSVKDIILSKAGPWDREPLARASIILKFGLSKERFFGRNGNDLDNLAKLVLDALSLEVKSKGATWRGYGIMRSDPYVLDLVLIKRETQPEYTKILVFPYEEREAFLDAVRKELF